MPGEEIAIENNQSLTLPKNPAADGKQFASQEDVQSR
jgi:hypothetical protein